MHGMTQTGTSSTRTWPAIARRRGSRSAVRARCSPRARRPRGTSTWTKARASPAAGTHFARCAFWIGTNVDRHGEMLTSRQARGDRDAVAVTRHGETRSTRRIDREDVAVIRPERRGRYRRRSSRCRDRTVEEAEHDRRVRRIVSIARAHRVRARWPTAWRFVLFREICGPQCVSTDDGRSVWVSGDHRRAEYRLRARRCRS